jgi:hypothetical protein
MNPHFLRNGAIALLAALVPFLSGAVEVTAADATAALSPPSNPLGDRAITDNNLARRVVLYEEDPGIPGGTSAVGSVVWSTEMLSHGTDNAAELTVRADIQVPERKLEMIWRLRHDMDLGSPTSHTIEIAFKLPPDFPSGGISNVPGLWMMESGKMPWREDTPLAGSALKVPTGYFILGLSAAPANTQLLKERAWFDIPIVYANNRRAILRMEKGEPGAQAFQQAFAAWNE